MNGFISDDKKHIYLPVPLGAIVYEVSTACSDVCTFQKELREKYQDLIYCDIKAPCHTRQRKSGKTELTLSNLHWILPKWGDTVFETEAEADSACAKLVEGHIAEMEHLGFKLRSDGYSITKGSE